MAMEAAESAYLAQLAADAKADAAAGYVEPWSMPPSLDEFAGKEGEDDGGLYGEWNEDGYSQEQSEYGADAREDSRAAGSDRRSDDDFIFAEPVRDYEHSQAGHHVDDKDHGASMDDDSDDFYGEGSGSPRSVQQPQQRASPVQPQQRASPDKLRGGSGKGREQSDTVQAQLDEPSTVEALNLVHVASASTCVASVFLIPRASFHACRGKPKIMLSIEGSIDAPALVFETRGCVAVCARLSLMVTKPHHVQVRPRIRRCGHQRWR